VTVPALCQRGHAVSRAKRKKLLLQKVVVLKTVIGPGGVEYPVSNVYQVEKPPKLLFAQFDIHNSASQSKHFLFYNIPHVEKGQSRTASAPKSVKLIIAEEKAQFHWLNNTNFPCKVSCFEVY
jgi:hypothetical protein